MNWKLLLLGLAIAGAAAIGWMWLTPADDSLFVLTLLHTNDVHAHYATPSGDASGGAARLASLVQSVRRQQDNVLLLDAGDQFQGTLLFTVGGARIVADVMNQIGYDAMCLGNHEFDAGPAELAQFVRQAEFPVLSANTDVTAEQSLSGLILPYALFTLDRQTVAVFGLTTEHTAVTSSPGPDVQFRDALSTAQQTVRHLESQGINKIIALTHLGYAQDVELAATVRGIDVIIGGHSHTLLDDYPTIVRPTDRPPVVVVTAHERGKALGRLDLVFTRDGVIAKLDGQLLPISAQIPQDDKMLELLAGYDRAVAELMMSIVGATDVPLDGARERVRSVETNLGNLVCDAMLWKTRSLGTAVALHNGGGVRASIPRGMITMAHILDVLPYGNQIAVLPLRGEQLIDTLEHGVGALEGGSGQFLQVSGLRYTYDPSSPPGERIRAVEIWDPLSAAFLALDPDQVLMVATNDFLAGGGDGFSMLADAARQPESYATGWLLSEALAEYFDRHSPIAPEVEDRIIEMEDDMP